MIRIITTLLVLALTTNGLGASEQPGETWVSRSDRNSQVLLEVLARFNPEAAGFLGIDTMDEEIIELSADREERLIEALGAAVIELQGRLESEADPRVGLDLEILIDAAELNIKQIRMNRRHLLPYTNVAQTIFQGVRSLLDEQSTPERRAAAATRLRRYAGLEIGFTPLAEQAKALLLTRLPKQELLGPFRGELERDLATADRYIEGIRELLAAYDIHHGEKAVDTIAEQTAVYNDFLRMQILPRAREDFRQPAEMYALLLETMGIDMPVDELASRAHVAFKEIQNEMQTIAVMVAAQRKMENADYREVIRNLKQEQLVGDEILMTYTSRIAELEAMIERHGVVSLPQRSMKIRLASEAESAAIPSPFMLPPKLIGNTGEMGEFVLPLRVPGDQGEGSSQIDDYTFAAASWTLAVHEGRPGHELQFTAMIENGVSLARSIFAFTSVNVEGWAVYCEAEMKPYMPLDGQLISLQQRLLRAARAFLDPGLQSGAIGEDEAVRLLENDVVLSPSMARQEIDRYTFMDPAQATSYFCGYTRLMELRAEAERKMGDRFDRREYHDFILSQGLLPPRLMRKAVLEHFVVGES